MGRSRGERLLVCFDAKGEWIGGASGCRIAGIERLEGGKHVVCESGVVSLGLVIPAGTKYIQEQSAWKRRPLGL
jgi:hypothetical protein